MKIDKIRVIQSSLEKGFTDLKQNLEAGVFSSAELTQVCLERLKLSQSELNCATEILEQTAMAEAHEADKRRALGQGGDLLGIPFGIKDNILAKGSRTTAASKMLQNYQSPYTATSAQLLRDAGMPLVCKLNMDEFGMGSSNENSFFGPVRNPWNLDFVPGGSSGGSAAAVAARLLPVVLGTDTGGSIRQPAGFCGVQGFKPSYGLVSRLGVIAYASSLDQVGPLAPSSEAIACVLDQICKHDPHDPTSQNTKRPSFSFSQALKTRKQIGNLTGMRIGIPEFLFFSKGIDKQVSAIVRHALEKLKSLGAELIPIELPHIEYSISTYYIIASSEASSNLSRFNGIHAGVGMESSYNEKSTLERLISLARTDGFGFEVKKRILLGTFSLSSGFFDAYFQKASQVRRLIYNDFKNAFEQCDLIATPTSPVPVFSFDKTNRDPLSLYFSDLCTLGVNLAGLPAVSLNVGFDDIRLPVGAQFIAPWFKDSLLIELAGLHEQIHPASVRIPPISENLKQRVEQSLGAI
jgi:aspartyl-tRNA(Asn)/glutamyl-tRNA(Gln) amidotransferase subunit A